MQKHYFPVAFVLLAAACSNSPTDRSFRVVSILEDLGTCSGVSVTVVGESLETELVTDSNGRIELNGLSFKDQDLTFSIPGYESVTRNIFTSVEGALNADLVFNLESVVVEGTVALDDGVNPTGTQVVVEGSAGAAGLEQVECVAGTAAAAGTSDLEFSGQVSEESEGASRPALGARFQSRDVQVDSEGKYRARVPRRGQEVTVRAEREGYTGGRQDVASEELQAAPADAPLALDEITLFPLTGFVNIVGGQYQNDPSVTLQISAFNGASRMALGEVSAATGQCVYGDWQAFEAETNTTVTGSDGLKTVCVSVRNDENRQVRDLHRDFVLDRSPPSLALHINGNDRYTSDNTVILTLSAGDTGSGLAGIRVADSLENLEDAAVVDFEATKVWTLAGITDGEAEKRVWAQAVDLAGNYGSPTSDLILFDNEAPTGLSISLNSGQAVTNDPTVLAILDQNGGVEMQSGEDPAFNGSAWVPVTTQLSLMLAGADGTRTVYYRVRDAAGNLSTVASDAIELDQTPPEPPELQVIDIDGDGFALSSSEVELSWSIPGSSTMLELERLVAGLDSSFVPVMTFGVLEDDYRDAISDPGRKHSYRIRAVDLVGNRSAWSLVEQALPFLPVTSVVWLRDEAGNYNFTARVEPGTFSLSGSYEYEDSTGARYSTALIDNEATYHRDVDWSRFNETLNLRTNNSDNSLVQTSTIRLGIQVQETVANEVGFTIPDISIRIDPDGNTHASYTNGVLQIGSNSSGSWQFDQIESNTVAAAALDLDSAGTPHVAYYDSSEQDLKYAHNTTGTWTSFPLATTGDVGRYPSLRLDGSNTSHISYLDASRGDLVYATNSAGTWVTAVVDSDGDAGHYSSLGLDAGGNIHIGYREAAGDVIRYATNSSGSWVTGTVDGAGGESVSLAIDQFGNAHLSYIQSGDLYHATNASGTWVLTTVDTTGSIAGPTSVALNSNGDVFIGYGESTSEDFKYATNASGAWVVSTIASAGKVGGSNALSIDPFNILHFAYFDSTEFFNEKIIYVSDASESRVLDTIDAVIETNPDTSLALAAGGVAVAYFASGNLEYAANITGVWDIETIDAAGTLGTSVALAFDGSGAAHVSYFDVTSEDLQYATNGGGSWSVETVESAGSAGRDSSLAVDNAGNVHIGYVKDGALIYTTGLSGSWVEAVVDSVAAAEGVSLVADSEGNIHIAYIDSNLVTLKYATNVTGSWQVETVGSAGSILAIGHRAAITVDGSGVPHIAYFDQAGSDLAYATNQSGSWITTHIDTDNHVGTHAAIATDTDGALYISYYDQTDGDLKVATNASGKWQAHSLAISGDTGKHTSVQIDSAGRAAISFYDATTLQVRLGFNFNGRSKSSTVTRIPPF